MFEIIVNTKSGKRVDHIVCDKPTCLLGKDKGCLVNLRGWKVSAIHALVEVREKGVFIEDKSDKQGLSVNGQKVSATEAFGPLSASDVVAIGDYRLSFKATGAIALVKKHVDIPIPKASVDINAHKEISSNSISEKKDSKVVELRAKKPDVESNDLVLSEENEKLQKIYEQYRSIVHKDLLNIIDLRRINVGAMSDDELRDFTAKAIAEVVRGIDQMPSEINVDELEAQVLAEAVGLGPLDTLLADDDISEIMVNSHRNIFFEKKGNLFKSPITFTDDQAVISAIERIVAPLGRRIDESSPMVDARLKDGSRVNAIIPPLALKGPSITIRKFMKERIIGEMLVDFGSVNEDMINFLDTCVKNKKNVVISGGTGSGKTTLLNVLSNFIPDKERIVTVEDAAELRLYQPNLVSLEARPPNQEGRGGVSIRELVKNCLRMRPDRIVVGECRGGEALDMLQAMNTGHDGSLTTVHANSPRDCISRLEVLVLMSGMDLPVNAIKEQISSAIDIIVQQSRFACGSRKVTSICEVAGVESNVLQLSEIFKFEQSGFDEEGKVSGEFKATGMIPDFYEEMRKRKIDVDLSIFSRGGLDSL